MTESHPGSAGAELPARPASTPASFPLPLSQEALEAMPFPFAIYTCDGLCLGANAQIEHLFQAPRSAVLGAFNLLDDLKQRNNGSHRLFEAAAAGRHGQTPAVYSTVRFPGAHSADRTGGWIRVRYMPFRDAAGQVTHVGAITEDVTEHVEAEREAAMFKALVENAGDGIAVSDMAGKIIFANPAFGALSGYGPRLNGMRLADLHPDEAAALAAITPVIAQQGSWRGQLMTRRADGSSFPADISSFLLRDHTGKPKGVASIMRDLTEQQHAEEERAALQAQVITAQQAALRELSTPLIPLADGVVAMPLIGSIDSSRAQLVVETLLTGSAELRAHTTIIDITGVPVVDTQVANTLLQAAQALKLLGAQVILTGIRPEVAQTLVGLGVDLRGISTRATLQSGIAEALAPRSDAAQARRW